MSISQNLLKVCYVWKKENAFSGSKIEKIKAKFLFHPIA